MGPEAGILSASSLARPFALSRCCTAGYRGYFCFCALPPCVFCAASALGWLGSGFFCSSSLGFGASAFAAGALVLFSAGISRVLMSSPSSAVTAILSPTLTPLVSLPCMILTMIPSSCASTSMVALSVSISRSTSPAEKDSPSLILQLAMLPSVMVGERAGMVKFWAARSAAEAMNPSHLASVWLCWKLK